MPTSSDLRIAVGPPDHIAGPDDAPFTLVEYGDFESAASAEAVEEVRRVQDAMGPRLRFVFRHFPNTDRHPNSLQAAEASEAAAEQGRFWPMYRVLFEHQQALETEALLAYAKVMGLDIRAFAEALEDQRFRKRIRRDIIGGVQSGVRSTPAFFLNGVRHQGDSTAEALIAMIDSVEARFA